MIRLFIALPLNETSRLLISTLAPGIPGARAVNPEQIHLTIRFIGEVDGAMLHDIKDELAAIKAAPLHLDIAGVGYFPPRGQPRVLWVGVAPSDTLLRLRTKINRQLKRCGVAPEQRKFHPHITIARLNNSPTPRVMRFIGAHHDLRLPPMPVHHFILYSSTFTSKGAVHTAEAIYPLDVKDG